MQTYANVPRIEEVGGDIVDDIEGGLVSYLGRSQAVGNTKGESVDVKRQSTGFLRESTWNVAVRWVAAIYRYDDAWVSQKLILSPVNSAQSPKNELIP